MKKLNIQYMNEKLVSKETVDSLIVYEVQQISW